ncbi:MAG TPA: GNAT family N-acetyltransferase [Thermoanaerobaculia bacterium]|nr:GNAT family N-acetyltransferase [Thermoanaerobaculia bacterium]
MDDELRIETARTEQRTLLEVVAAQGNDAPYDLLTVLSEKCFDPGFSGPSLVLLAFREEEPAGFAVVCGRFLRLLVVSRPHRHTGVGSALLTQAEQHVAKDGQMRIAVGAEAGNYFVPGVPEDDPAVRFFLEKLGYDSGPATSNLECSLNDNPLLYGSDSDEVRRALASDRQRVTRFIEENFGRIWAFETQAALRNNPPTVFIAERNGGIDGFSAHDSNNRGLGFFGPTGVQTSQRGKGLGKALLLASLRDLRNLGYPKAVIPWTDAIDFYRKSCGAVVGHRFVSYVKTL